MGSSSNPFVVPRAVDPGRPLVPWLHPEHADYYVAIDGMEQAFDAFQRFADCDAMRDTGSLVVVTGAAASGKTSLINRCVHWLTKMADEERCRVVVVDLTGVVRQPGLTLGDRFTLVTEGLFRAGLEHGFLRDDFGEEFRSRPDRYERMVDQFSARLRSEDAMVAVLLPASELGSELDAFTRLVAPGLVLFAESGFVAVADAVPERNARTRVLHLKVGTLKAGDAESYIQARLSGTGPMTVDSAALEDLLGIGRDGLRLPIGFLQRLLAGLWDEAERNPDRADTEITPARMLEYIVRVAVRR